MSGHIYLVGFMASGKTTVGQQLAKRMNRTFCDLDDLIEEDQNRSISKIFSSQGEAYFRNLESKVLMRAANLPAAVFALGGGTYIRESNRDFIGRSGVAVWLKISLDAAMRRCRKMTHRPLAHDPDQFALLYHARKQVYRQADIHVDTEENSPQQICDTILSLFRDRHGIES